MRKPILVLAALLVGAGGVIHLQQWLDVYRDIPTAVPGWYVVRIGFPLNAAASAVLAIALLVTAFRRFSTRASAIVVGAVLAFEVSSLGSLIVSRTGSVLGWNESGWTTAANRTRAVEIGAIVLLAVALFDLVRAPQRQLSR